MDISLYCQEKGNGTPFVFLHGNGDSGDYFEKQTEYFSHSFKTVCVDTRGHGKTARGTAPFTMEQFADDLKLFLESKGLSDIILLGFSDGANIAMKFALKYQGKLKALILNGGNLNTKGVKAKIQIPIEIGYRTARLFAKKSPYAKKNTEILGLMVNEPNIDPESLKSIITPTLVIAGTNDMIKEKHTRQIAENIPNASLSILKGDHFIASKQADLFNKEVERFLERNGIN